MTSVDGAARPEQAAAVDWNDIYRRLESAQERLARDATPSPVEQRAIFRSRARALAREPELAAAAQSSLEIIEFRLASETYGLDAAFVREVLALKDFTPLPGAPDFVVGIFGVRGEILSIVDLKHFFSLPRKGLGQLSTVIVLRNRQLELGLLVDAVLGVRRLALNTLQPSLPTITGIGAAYILGVTSERVIILDVEKILGDESIIVYQEAE